MEEERKNSQLVELIKNHPQIAKITGSFGGLIFLSLLGRISGIIDNVDFADIINYATELVLFIKSIPNIIWVVLIIVTGICIFKFISDYEKTKRKFLKNISEIIQNDPNIIGISLGKLDLKIQRQNTTKESNKENDKTNIIDFPSQKES